MMYDKCLKTLEYDKIIGSIAEEACSLLAKKKITSLTPLVQSLEVEEALADLDDAFLLLNEEGSVDFTGLEDVRPAVKKSAIGGSLSISDLYDVKILLRIVRSTKNYFKGHDLGNRMAALADLLYFDPSLYEDLESAVVDRTNISDDATPTLRSLHRKIQRKNDEVNEKLKAFISNKNNEKYLQDSIVTVRDGRYVVPIKREYKGQVDGLVHDISSSGGTYFIEPARVVELNNEIRELHIAIEEEILRIIKELSGQIGLYHEPLEYNVELLTQMDFVFAKAKYAKKMNHTRPTISKEFSFTLKQIAHPLIPVEDVVHTDVFMPVDNRALVITGPNTGGKTVVLKTVGLIALLAKSGCYIPAGEGSSIPLFDNVFTDIGDEQSIEQNLSTFSSHMVNIVDILQYDAHHSLYLFDELGAGTDPTEGAALAMSILDTLIEKDVKVMATTHYAEIKLYALQREGVVNGSMEFDISTLAPTYRLTIGLPGRSNAFDISRKLGFEEKYIEKAMGYISEKSIAFEDVLSEIESNRQTSEQLKAEMEELRKEAKRREEETRHILQKEREKAERSLNKAKEEAQEIYRKAQREYESILKDAKILAHSLSKEQAQEIQETRDRLRKHLDSVQKKPSKSKKSSNLRAEDIQLGKTYYIRTIQKRGQVVELPNESGDLKLQVGILKLNANLRDLDVVHDVETKQQEATSQYRATKSMYVKPEIDVRGLNAEEMYDAIDKYLDDCFMAGLKEVTILHGKGTGVLRSTTHAIVKKHPHVKSYRLGNVGEGDTGVTIVTFK
ncbi:MAG: endonuclease MutS2 [Tissierellia bacterium]|nr:endonuclease MutS2 [Tissierellia bacterium]